MIRSILQPPRLASWPSCRRFTFCASPARPGRGRAWRRRAAPGQRSRRSLANLLVDGIVGGERGLGGTRSGFRRRQTGDRGRDWNGAIKALTSAGLRDDRNADIQNYLGYAYRRLRQLDAAMRHYQLALTLNPRHRSAHEHLGEAHLVKAISPKPRSISRH